ncbi:hypothetical protein WV31_02820 [Magnetospirillum sp. ME-1]|uniref:hypothetical protein n=1 Tax=Magnetospirillum sp. ME-1 TaxID=1639348 RepID=UPI000A17B410|nr:hypothetical protein [Magnetospirillum sp. ME-1]ARJ64677.1 hypothetical protein WV31_02820 [Magnetospirillum sp. ME-1]
MTADHARIVAMAVEIAAKRRPRSVLTPTRLAEFMSVDLGEVLTALASAPAHVQVAFGLAKPALSAFKLRGW